MEWVGSPFVAGSRPQAQYILVTLAIFGLQFVWSIEQSYVSLYLLDLGLSKSVLSLVWIASPVSGLIVQPIVGLYSDLSTSHYGRRRPYMVWGSIVTATGLVVFAWSREIAEMLHTSHISALGVSIIAILTVDIAVNVCQACARALIVDMFNERRQKSANAWAGRMASIGHLISYFLSIPDLRALGFNTQLKAACTLYSVVLLITVAVSSVSVRERVLVMPITIIPSSNHSDSLEISDCTSSTLRDHLAQFKKTVLDLDPQLSAIFKVQLLAWYAWFTFLFYGATYASEVWGYSQTTLPDTDEMARAGSLALTVFSLSSTFFTLILPKLKMNIIKIWIASFVVYALAMTATNFAINLKQVLVIFATAGFTWACTLWVPFALTSERIHQLPLTDVPAFEREPIEDELLVDSDSIDDSVSLTGHEEKSGIIMGIHNSALTLPQFISAFSSFVIFQLVDKDPGNSHSDGGKAIAITLQVGGVTAIIAAFYAHKLNQQKQQQLLLQDLGTEANVSSP